VPPGGEKDGGGTARSRAARPGPAGPGRATHPRQSGRQLPWHRGGSQTVTSTTTPTYDAAGNRTQVAATSGGSTTTTNYSTDALNFYTSVGGTTHVRDANGNLTDDGTNEYEWDYRNQLVRIKKKSDQSVVGSYEHDAIGRRRAKTAGGTSISFYWIGLQRAVEEDGQGVVSRRHYGATFGEVVSAHQRDVADLDQDGSAVDYVSLTPAYDGAFDCVAVFDHAGVLAESYVHAYDGAASITNGAGNPLATSALGWQQGYGRMYRDDESGLLYSVHRYYASGAGRFLSEDPVGRWFDDVNIGNGYGWSGNRYRNGWDPLGLEADPNRILVGIMVASLVPGFDDVEAQLWEDVQAVEDLVLVEPEDAGSYGLDEDFRAATAMLTEDGKGIEWRPWRNVPPFASARRGYRIFLNAATWRAAPRYQRIRMMLHEIGHVYLYRRGCVDHRQHHTKWTIRYYRLRVFALLTNLRDRAPDNNLLKKLSDNEVKFAKAFAEATSTTALILRANPVGSGS